MKRFLLAIFVAFFASSIAFASMPTSEPELPSDVSTYELQQQLTCGKYEGKVLVFDSYTRTTDPLMQIITITLNGQKIAQAEILGGAGSSETTVSYVRNSPAGNWLRYGEEESAASDARVLAEIGLTIKQFDSCLREAK